MPFVTVNDLLILSGPVALACAVTWMLWPRRLYRPFKPISTHRLLLEEEQE